MSNLRDRHAKILATVGPSSSSPEMLEKLVNAGVDAFRLNFSHGDYTIHEENIKNIRALEAKIGRPITILQDLQGPKIRLGEFADGKSYNLNVGDTFHIDGDKTPGDKNRCHLPHPEILDVLKVGDNIFINDGIVRLRIVAKNDNSLTCGVFEAGTVSSRKGINLPGVDLPISSITQKDWADLDFGLKMDVDWVAISFVQKEDDILDVKKKVGHRAAIIAKIEMPNAVKRIDAIIAASDGIMVARGDLGVECPIEDVPSIQKRLIRKCRTAGIPVIVATQMLESMIENASPTRAEVSDVANATFEGADALMLSAESAAGKYPEKAVETMDRVIKRAEQSSAWRPLVDARYTKTEANTGDAITHAAARTAEVLEAKAIVTFTEYGSTALRMSRQRPIQPILALTSHLKTARRINLAWGLHCQVKENPTSTETLITLAEKGARDADIVKKGDQIVLTAGLPFGVAGTTNMIRVLDID
ncbi:MAG: pyruvate kinase [Alphaproteobacteria bacterium]